MGDRFVVAPCLENRSKQSFFGVFDGTVGDFASENVKDLVIPKLLESPHWRAVRSLPPSRSAEAESHLEAAMRDMYRNTDSELLRRCAEEQRHYSTCTAVTLVSSGDYLIVSHLGDSRIVFGKEEVVDAPSGKVALVAEQMTKYHKPDLEQERARIEECGGSVVLLQNHGSKPFIRGGDFLARKAKGDQPMQLQYSRAFGAKDLKVFGLSCIPDIRIIRVGAQASHPEYRYVKFAILASDGLWDVVSAQEAVDVAKAAVDNEENPAKRLVETALLKCGTRSDNITAVCVNFDRRDG